MDKPGRLVILDYTDYRGERGERCVRPVRLEFFEGGTAVHSESGWYLHAYDEGKGKHRLLAMSGVHAWRPLDGEADE